MNCVRRKRTKDIQKSGERSGGIYKGTTNNGPGFGLRSINFKNNTVRGSKSRLLTQADDNNVLLGGVPSHRMLSLMDKSKHTDV